jgi:hypothetical protein
MPVSWRSSGSKSGCYASEFLMDGTKASGQAISNLACSRLFRRPDGLESSPIYGRHPPETSGRGDLNARPPAPKAVFGMVGKRPIFNCFGFKQMRRACCSLWNCEETGGSASYISIYTPVQ